MQVRVKAGKVGFFGLCRRREGEVFEIESEQQFSKKWMEKVKSKNGEAKAEKTKKRESSPKAKEPTGDKKVI